VPNPPYEVAFRFTIPTGFGVLWIAEFSGNPTAVDKTNNSTATSTTASTGTTGALSQADEIILSFISHATPQVATYTGGFSTLIDDDNPGFQDGETRYLIATATTARNDTWTVSSEEWATAIATFRCSAGAALVQETHNDGSSVPSCSAMLTNIPGNGNMIVAVFTAGSGLTPGFTKPYDSYGSNFVSVIEFDSPSLYVGVFAAFDFKRNLYDGREHPNHTISEAATARGRSDRGTFR
jgi:hypothetical protein